MAPPPDEEEVKVAYTAIDEDVRKWMGVAAVLREAGRQTQELGLSGFEIGYIPMGNGVGTKYNQVQELMISMLNQGATATEEIAGALIQVREDYERSDERAAIRTASTMEGN